MARKPTSSRLILILGIEKKTRGDFENYKNDWESCDD